MTTPLLATLAGLGFGLSLIVAIGAQNAFVLRQGLLRSRVGAVVAICALSDAALIAAGVAGIGVIVERVPLVLVIVRLAGAVFLAVYGVLAARRALRPAALTADARPGSGSLWTVMLTCLALTWLNPHVYLDTVLLLGSVANTHGDDRWWFALGAAAGSVLWFSALGYGARLLRPVFARPLAWRILDAAIAVVMLALAVSLVIPLLLPS